MPKLKDIIWQMLSILKFYLANFRIRTHTHTLLWVITSRWPQPGGVNGGPISPTRVLILSSRPSHLFKLPPMIDIHTSRQQEGHTPLMEHNYCHFLNSMCLRWVHCSICPPNPLLLLVPPHRFTFPPQMYMHMVAEGYKVKYKPSKVSRVQWERENEGLMGKM